MSTTGPYLGYVGPPDPDDFVLLPDRRPEDWDTLLQYAEHRTFEQGETVAEAGEEERALYLVVSGRLEARGPEGQRLQVIDRRSAFGEVAFFDGRARSATVRALGAGEVARLDPETFDRLAGEHPELARKVLWNLGRILAARLRRALPETGESEW